VNDSKIEIFKPINPDLIRDYNQTRQCSDKEILCFAPFKSIRFAHNGYALACCHNRSAILGKYPEQSVREIWFGEPAQKLRRYILANDLSMGCQKCKQNINNRAFGSVDAQKFDYASDLENGNTDYPVLMEFQIDNTCNLECIQCRGDNSSSIRKNRDQLPPFIEPYDDIFVDQLAEFLPHVKKIGFAGGEPLLGPINAKIWERCTELNPTARINVMTNGTTLNSRFKRVMEQGNFHMSVSIDSMIRETYESIRLNSNLDIVISNIDYFIDYSRRNNRHFSLHTCFMIQNWREIPDIVNYCNERDVLLYYHIVYFPTDCSLFHVSIEIQREILEYYQSYTFKTTSHDQVENVARFDSLISLLESWIQSSSAVDGITVTMDDEEFESVEDYKTMIVNSISQSVHEDHTIDEDVKEKHLAQVLDKFEKICIQIDDNPLLKSSLKNISKLPGGMLISELEIAPLDSLVEMVKTAGRKTQPKR